MAEVEYRADPLTTQQSPNNNSFIFTCFGAFLNVTDNPSRKVAKLVQSTLTTTSAANSNNTTQKVADIPVHELEVSKDYVIKFFDDLYQQLEADHILSTQSNTSSSVPPPTTTTVFLIHFGVHRCASHIHIERRGLNCAHYHPGPDANGFLCQNEPILTPPPPPSSTSPSVEFFPPATNSKLWDAVGSTLTQNISPVSVLRGGTVNSSSSAAGNGSSGDEDNLRLIRGYIETPISLKWIEDTCRDVNKAIYKPHNGSKEATTINTDMIASENDNEKKVVVELKPSHDAGQYLCNTALFCSLAVTAALQQQAAATTTKDSDIIIDTTTAPPPRYVSLFIHVVNEEVLDVEKQAALVSAFLLQLQQATYFQ